MSDNSLYQLSISSFASQNIRLKNSYLVPAKENIYSALLGNKSLTHNG